MARVRFRFILLTMGLAIAAAVVAFFAAFGPYGAAGITIGLNTLMAGYLLRTRDVLMARLVFFGLIAGFGELFTDYWSVSVFKTLIYPKVGPFIWTSPAYMPFSWLVVIVQLGYFGYAMRGRYGLVKSSLLMAVVGGVNIPVYEYLAKNSGFWSYENCRMLLGTTPYYIIGFEILLSVVLPATIVMVATASWGRIVVIGLAYSFWLWLAQWIAHSMTG
jgi:hypothetical protein